jgi:hypothetical protein
MKPHGALSKEKTIKVAENCGNLYCVLSKGNISEMRKCSVKRGIISFDTTSKDKIGKRALKFWFPTPQAPRTFMFDNYFHALAYSLKLKAEHGKSQSEERAGVAGAP